MYEGGTVGSREGVIESVLSENDLWPKKRIRTETNSYRSPLKKHFENWIKQINEKK